MRRMHLKLFKKANYGGVLIGADRDPSQLEIPDQLEMFSSDIMWSQFDAYPHVRAVTRENPDRRDVQAALGLD
jgi:hypothetical protein